MPSLGWLPLLGLAGDAAAFAEIVSTDGTFGEVLPTVPVLPRSIDSHTRIALEEAFRQVHLQSNKRAYNARTTTTSCVAAAEVVLVDASASPVTITLMSAMDWPYKAIAIKKLDGGANSVKVIAQAGETIDGTATQSLAAQYAVIRVCSNGVRWHVV